jgi:hypothetical protein
MNQARGCCIGVAPDLEGLFPYAGRVSNESGAPKISKHEPPTIKTSDGRRPGAKIGETLSAHFVPVTEYLVEN